MNKLNSHKDKLFKKISDFICRKSLMNISISLIKSLLIISILFLLFTSLEVIFYFGKDVKTGFIILLFLIFIAIFSSSAYNWISSYINSNKFHQIESASKEIGDYYPNIKDNLLNSLQIISTKSSESSAALIDAAFENTYRKVSAFNFIEIINYSKLKRNLIVFFSLLFTVFLLFAAFGPIREGASRLLSFRTEFTKPVEFSLEIISGNKKIKRGQNILLEVKANGKIPKSVYLSTKSIVESEFTKHVLNADSLNRLSLELRDIKNEFVYYAHSGEVITDTFKVTVTSPPLINQITFEIIPPNYSKVPISIQENNGNITALKGTRVNFDFLSTKELVSAYRYISDGSSDSLKINGKNVSGNFRIYSDDKYFFRIIDNDNNSNENPIEYSLKVLSDLHPNIEIIRPEQVSLIPNNDIVSINYNVKDDFGFTKVLLYYFIGVSEHDEKSEELSFVELNINKNEIEQSLFFNWDLARLSLKENEYVSYYLEVFDNDFVSGPKSTKSSLYKLRIPTLNELYAEADNTQESAIEELVETLKDAEELQTELNQLSNELKQDEKEINWNEKEKIEESVKKFEEITGKIEEVQEKLENMRQQMTENNLLSEETMEMYNELQDLMDELSSEEMKKALEDMQKSLEQLMRDKVQQSLENMALNEEMFQKSIERTLNLLKKIQVEQKMDEVIKRTQKIVEDIDKLSEETEKNSKEQNQSKNNELAENQKNIENQLNSLEEQMKNLQDKMSEISDMPTEEMEKLNKEFDQQENQELSKEAMERLQEKNPFDALKNQEKLSQNMNSMMDKMQQMQQQMQMQNQQMVMQNMLKAIDNIIGLSKEQEMLGNKSDKLKANPRQLSSLASDQLDLKQNLDNILRQLGELSQKTFAITPEMGEKLGLAKSNMDQALEGMQSHNSQKSTFGQSESMKNLNEAASLLQKSLQAMMQGGGQGSGMMSLMQQLQQMAQQQMGLNQMTQMMQKGQLSMQQQAQLQRLAQEQAAIQKSLAELNKEAREAGESKKLSSNLEKILEEMKEVVSGLNTQKIDDDLIRKQDKILSKLLDAQRSINERDFEKNRESFSGKNFNQESPNELLLNDEQAKDILREELLKSLKEGYSKDYQELIRRYFQTLEDSSN